MKCVACRQTQSLDSVFFLQVFYFVDVPFHGIFLGSPFHAMPGIPLGLAFEVHCRGPFYIYVTHGCLFLVAVDEQQVIVCWPGLEVLNLLSSFLKLSLSHSYGVGCKGSRKLLEAAVSK